MVQIGHAGTLDPMATGLLIICTGKATKTIDSFQAMHKEYSGEHVCRVVDVLYSRAWLRPDAVQGLQCRDCYLVNACLVLSCQKSTACNQKKGENICI